MTHRDCQEQCLAQQFDKLKNHVLDEINASLNSKPRGKDNWSIEVRNLCTCENCQVLNEYLSSSSRQKMIWPLAKNARKHIHRIIDDMNLPVTHTTERSGSPYKLHLTKTEQLFKREEAIRDRYTNALELLANL